MLGIALGAEKNVLAFFTAEAALAFFTAEAALST
jgi:hypothetical protein